MKKMIACSALILLAACNQAVPEKTAQAKTEAPAAALNVAQQAYAKVNEEMHAGMADIPADADVAFVQGMIAHHKGAIAMSKVVLDHGKDPANRTLAQAIIDAQTREIAQMEAWLKERGVKAEPAAEVDHAAMGH
jgi:uncharacterized protein (DUF305 family)